MVYKLNKSKWLYILIVLSLSIPCTAQEDINLGREVSGTLAPEQPNVIYTFTASRGEFLELTLNIEERDFSLAVSVLDVLGNVVAYSEGTNYPQFAGAYLQFEAPASGTFEIQIETFDLNRSTPYTLSLRLLPEDEQRRTLQLFETKSGIIGPDLDQDEFLISLRRGSPVLFVVSTPNNILDSLVAVIGPDGELANINYNFFGTSSVLLFHPEVSGNYMVIVAGEYEQSAGPYTLIVNTVPIFSPPFSTMEELIISGEAYVFEMQLQKSKTYEFSVTGVDDFRPFIVLTDRWMNMISRSSPMTDIPVATIPGFTPLFDESLYLFVLGETTEMVGNFGVDVIEVEDEEPGIELSLASPFAGVIGPLGDVDGYLFTAEEDERYSILVNPTWHLLDPAVKIFDLEGNEIFYNDDSAGGLFSILSNITFPSSGEYQIEVLASPDQPREQYQTGVYVIELATGAAFDQAAPVIFEEDIEVNQMPGTAQISIPTYAIMDDTYPLSATLTFDKADRTVDFEIMKDLPVELDLDTPTDEIFFLEVTDSADSQNTSSVTLPAPRVIATLEGTPYGMAVDQDNNLYITDADIGGVYEVTIEGATEYVLLNQGSGGGVLGPNALAFDTEEHLYLANGFMHSIVRFMPDGAVESVAEGLNFPVDIAFDEEGVLYVAQIGSDTVDRILDDGTVETLVTGIRNPNGLAFSPSGELYVSNNDRGQSSIFRILDDGTAEPFVSEFAETLQGIAFDRDGFLYAADGISGVVYRISPEGEYRIFTRGLSGPVDLAFGYNQHSSTLFATNMGIEAPGFYATQVIAIPTAREGLPLPYGSTTEVDNWFLY